MTPPPEAVSVPIEAAKQAAPSDASARRGRPAALFKALSSATSDTQGKSADSPTWVDLEVPDTPLAAVSEAVNVSVPTAGPVPHDTALFSWLHNGHLAATFSKVEQLAEDSRHTVFRALHRLENVWYAIKPVVIRGLGVNEDVAARAELREVRSLGSLRDSRHVVRYVDSWCEEPGCLQGVLPSAALPGLCAGPRTHEEAGSHTAVLLIQMELCNASNAVSLRSWLDARHQASKQFPNGASREAGTAEAMRLAKHLLKACREIHRVGLVHTGLKTESLFVVRDSALKVGDFGLARPLFVENGPTGLQDIAAPAAADDVFDAAMVMLELLLPAGMGKEAVDEAVSRFRLTGELPAIVEEQLPKHADLLRQMASKKPEDRPSASDAHAALKRLKPELPDTPLWSPASTAFHIDRNLGLAELDAFELEEAETTLD